ncbi:hypothetical protein GOFOIKOB_6358 [Methylobacterium tardum]|uniref:hypothetical protein n=1 Tax=Methylobacterium tardum TaxID=374432 RepID=UPI001EDD7441|nr:hypothetical protein [Methylobacterium tardum]URD37869.1 hypothetical protein M6G65_04880 [Methylobacterium tardum]GJE53280.1 hypothetical protein GOFOIKOB_6358 [Methylobacterium tardum]
MSIAPIGLITIFLGIVCLQFGQKSSLYVFLITCLLGSSSAITLGSSGQIQPVHLFILFLVPYLLLSQSRCVAAIDAITFPNPGFWLLGFTVVSIFAAYFYPRIFEGATNIFAVGATESGQSLMLTPLAPVGGNTTQSIYCMANLTCFVVVLAIVESKSDMVALATAFLFYGAGNIIFAFLDVVTFYTGTDYLLSIIRNTTYVMHVDEISNGLKRIAGSFTEASSFSTATLGVFGYSSVLWLYGVKSFWSGSIALISLVMLLISTSSTAIVCAPAVLALLYFLAMKEASSSNVSASAIVVVVGIPCLILSTALLLAINQTYLEGLNDFLATLIFDKAQSQSGLERAGWNAAALQNFIDTRFLGAGLGSVRASSFILALLSNVGVPGAILFFLFLFSVLFRKSDVTDGLSPVRSAAKIGMLGLLMSSIVSGALVDLGFQFYLFSALACSEKKTSTRFSSQ